MASPQMATISGFKRMLLMVAMVILSAAVFNWGLQYKMSLYGDHPGPSKASVAKLWTGSKDNSAAQQASLTLQEQSPVVVQVMFLTVFLALFFARQIAISLATFVRWQRIGTQWKLPVDELNSEYFLRPPPVSA